MKTIWHDLYVRHNHLWALLLILFTLNLYETLHAYLIQHRIVADINIDWIMCKRYVFSLLLFLCPKREGVVVSECCNWCIVYWLAQSFWTCWGSLAVWYNGRGLNQSLLLPSGIHHCLLTGWIILDLLRFFGSLIQWTRPESITTIPQWYTPLFVYLFYLFWQFYCIVWPFPIYWLK